MNSDKKDKSTLKFLFSIATEQVLGCEVKYCHSLDVGTRGRFITNKKIDFKDIRLVEKKVKEYNEYTGITASIADNSMTFIYSCEYDYTNISKFSKVTNNYIFEGGTENNVVKFKMEAEGFECE